MIQHNLLVWNVRGLNSRARRSVVRELVAQERVSLLTLQETKLDVCDDALVMDLLGPGFDYFCLPADNTRGGILLAWRSDTWAVSNCSSRTYSITAKISMIDAGHEWWLSCVYGPQDDREKCAFLQELRDMRSVCAGTWTVCGDFNLIYRAVDKNNDNLNRCMMGRFRRFLDDMELLEIQLQGRLFTWSNERDSPTLERLDRVFVSDDWMAAFPDHALRALASECSDHAPLLFQTDCMLHSFRRFRFENIWPRYSGYLDTIREAWSCPTGEADPFRALDIKLRNTAKALKRWSAKHVGSVRLQLAIAKEIVLRLDSAMEIRQLQPHEQALRKSAKHNCLGLASLLRTITRQRSRITFLAEGDANTKFFHLQACHRNRKNNIQTLLTKDDVVLIHEEAKAEAIFNHFDEVLGKQSARTVALDFHHLGFPQLDLSGIDQCFSEEEVFNTIKEMPTDKAPGPDGFTGLFYKTAWPIVKHDVMRAFHALWSLDGRSLYLLNQAYMVLLKKKMTHEQ